MHPRALVLVLVLASVIPASGCITPQKAAAPATQAGASAGPGEVHALAEVLPFEATAADGVKLRGHVYLPDGEGPFATILEFSPYLDTLHYPTDDAEVEKDGRRTMKWWNGPFLEAGFAVALVNIRGTGDSGGCFLLGNPQDGEDAVAVIETLAVQPWSNGNVGMHGFSYPAFVTYAALAAGPPSLKAAIPEAGGYDQWAYHTRNGAAISDAVLVPPTWTAGAGGGAFAAAGVLRRDPFLPRTSPDHFCPETAPGWAESAEAAWNGDANEWYEARDLRDELAGTTVPVLVGVGLRDWHFTPFLDGLWDRLAGDKRFFLGQHAHIPGMDTERGADFMRLAVAWFDHYLRGGPLPPGPGPVEYRDDAGGWHVANQWPPAGNATVLHLSDGTLVPETGEAAPSAQAFQSAPTDPGLHACAPHQALYVSQPLQEDVLLVGNFVVNVTLTSTLPDGNFAAALYSTPGDGSCPDPSARLVEMALTDLRHAAGGRHGSDFPVGVPGTVNVRSHPFASLVPEGHRLVLAIGGGSERLWPDARMPLLTVHTGPGIAGEITVPVVQGALRFR